jgi:DNA-binding Lrp family transcriptional regulator
VKTKKLDGLPPRSTMPLLLSEKELKVLKVLTEDSDRPQKQAAALAGMSDAEFSRTKNDLLSRQVIKKFTISIDYKKVGYPEIGVLFASVFDKKLIKETVATISEIPEAIAIFEAFGQEFDLVIKLMCQTNEQLREITEQITNIENIRAKEKTFTVIYSRVFKDEPGVPI